jgi:hypothetical protein
MPARRRSGDQDEGVEKAFEVVADMFESAMISLIKY